MIQRDRQVGRPATREIGRQTGNEHYSGQNRLSGNCQLPKFRVVVSRLAKEEKDTTLPGCAIRSPGCIDHNISAGRLTDRKDDHQCLTRQLHCTVLKPNPKGDL